MIFYHILPLLILAGFSIMVLIVITLSGNLFVTTILSATAYIAAFISILFTGSQTAEAFNILLVDRFGMFFSC
jgi:NADH:ubiquinone oxidoreductase subunit 2 (subunit N)